MNFFSFSFKKLLIILFLLSLPLLTVKTKKNPGEISWYYYPINFVTSFFQLSYTKISEAVKDTTFLYINLIGIKKNNLKLLVENSEIKTKLAQMEEIKTENIRLREMLNFKKRNNLNILAAKVISQDLLSDHFTISINRGTNHGIQPQMAVITTNGIVGYILRADYLSSQVLLLTDRYAVIDAVVQRTRARGIVEGKSKHECQLRYLERADDVAIGDVVVTSGLDKMFPKGFPIGIVVDIKKQNYGASLKVSLRPLIESKKVEEVFVVFPQPQES